MINKKVTKVENDQEIDRIIKESRKKLDEKTQVILTHDIALEKEIFYIKLKQFEEKQRLDRLCCRERERGNNI